jgi:hypothetical protein
MGIIALVSAVASGFFSIGNNMIIGQHPTFVDFVMGAIIGTVVANCAASAEYFPFMRSLNRLPFVAIFLLRLFLWCGITIALIRVVGADPRFYGTGVTFSFALGTVFTFVVYLRRLVGGRTLLRFVTGR